ncbi:Holliday junction ATP-dependent DNA helicase RuvA [hydrothermal vent metagenome]|uniref:Holliday junction ATP-dependent DNA helicase RuvA n=1 Tax=hydrothermal vent metagenome TaxID=652676 RepID=A0A3B1C978_9ZZZZ
MIARLSGILVSKKPAKAVIDISGVGYLVNISLQTFYALPEEGKPVTLDIHTHVREDAIMLFGFAEAGELLLFQKLISINKVGPKLAITILSGISFSDFITAIFGNDTKRLSGIPGIGKKTAERLVMELKDKLNEMAEAGFATTDTIKEQSAPDDAVEALCALGYKETEAKKAVKSAREEKKKMSLEETLKQALQRL